MKTFQLLLALTFILQQLAKSQEQDIPPIIVEKLSEHLFMLTGGRGANSGMYIGDNEVLLIDSKMDKASVEGIFTAVDGFTNKPVTYLVNTHSDGDHINGNEFFPDRKSVV